MESQGLNRLTSTLPRLRGPGSLVLVALLALVALVAAMVISSLDDSKSESLPAGDGRAVSESDATQTFSRLRDLARRSIQERDLTLLSLAFTSDGPTATAVSREIQRLREAKVQDLTDVRTQSVDVISRSDEQIEVREVVRLYPCFRTNSGADVTKGDAEIEQVGRYTLLIQRGEWRIHDIVLEKEKVIDRSRAQC